MGSLRTINHPAVEIKEHDLSGVVSTAGGTTSLVIGFSKQGESMVPVSPTSKASVKSYFGTPETEAERYFYYGCAEVFDKGGKLIAARIPYNNNSQYLTPAVKYNINQYATKIVKVTGDNPEEYVNLGTSFASAPTTADVTNEETKYGGIGTLLKIDALAAGAEFDPDDYPDVEEVTVYGKSMLRLSGIRGVTSEVESWLAGGDSYGEDGTAGKTVFYQLVTSFTKGEDDSSVIEAIAKAGSQNYQWIRWEVPTASKVLGSNKEKALVASVMGCKRADVPSAISGIKNFVTITAQESTDDYGFIKLEDYQNLRDGATKVDENTITIANITEQCLGADTYNNSGEEILGIVPVLVGGFQALPKQSRIEIPTDCTNARIANSIEQLTRGKSLTGIAEEVVIKRYLFADASTAKTLANTDSYNPYESTYSNDVVGKVPTITLNSNYKPTGEQMNQVTLVVCQLAISAADDNKLVLNVLETFTGSLDRTATDSKGNSTFIDDIVNSEDSGSSYVRMFSNYVMSSDFKGVDQSTSTGTEYIEAATLDNTAVLTAPSKFTATEWFTMNKNVMSIGFTAEQTKKYIKYSTITAAIESIFDSLSNVDETEIDLVVDCGLSTIANRIKLLGDATPSVQKFEYDIHYDKISSVEDIAAWKSICSKFLTFCSTTRKDCMAVIDAPRSLCVKDGVKLVKAGSKYSIDYDILPKFNYLAGLNSSYGAGYCDWLCYVDDFSGKNTWLPPSIAAEGAIILTDYNYNYWEAPAGEKRGVVSAAFDVAFNPNGNQQDSIYGKSWNYAVSDSTQGIMLWGQKTLLSSSAVSAFDRINVRRLFLRLERTTRKFLKSYIFELNTAKNRNRIVDGLTPVYENVKTMGGLYDYQLVVNSTNNGATVIDNNELRFAALLKPSKVAEFIIADFFALSTGMDFTEAYSEL